MYRELAEPDIQAVLENLNKDGYSYVSQAVSPEAVQKALVKVSHWYEATKCVQSDRMPYLNAGQSMVYNLQSKDLFFIRLLLGNPLVRKVLMHFLNDQWFTKIPAGEPNYILRSFLARSSNHQMPMHIDSFIPSSGRHSFMMQCALLLEDSNETNGCTVLVPGSHLSDEYTTQDSFATARPMEAKAGDLIFWDSRLWHGARANVSSGSRWAMIATFGRWWIKQAFDIPASLPQSIYDQLTDSEKAVLGFCSVPYHDETRGIDMKRSYDLLPEQVRDCKN